jgi:hypothetical protein
LAATLFILAFPGLLARRRHAWTLVFYGVLALAAYNLLAREIYYLVVGTTVALYLWFQIRARYS